MKRLIVGLFIIMSALNGCGAGIGQARTLPPFLALLTPVLPVVEGQCTGVIVGPRHVLAPKHCPKVKRVVTVTGQEAWVASLQTLPDHDLALLTTDRVLWVSEFAEFSRPEFGVRAELWGYCPYVVSHVARHALYNGLAAVQIEDWPDYDYGTWFMVGGKVCGGDSGAPVLQRGKVVGIVSLHNVQVYAGKIAYTVPSEYARELMEMAHELQATVQSAD